MMSDISDSVRIQQAVLRLLRWHKAAEGRAYGIWHAVELTSAIPPMGCRVVDEHGKQFMASGATIHEAIDAALTKAGAPT